MEKTIVKSEGNKPDLGWQKPAESDNLNKSERPDAEYMEERHLCPDCHGQAHPGANCDK
jgi:hypothetical protein